LPVGFEPVAQKTSAGAPIYFGLGVRGQAAIGAVDDRKVEVPESFDGSSKWRFMSASFVGFPKSLKTEVSIFIDDMPPQKQTI
jgi:hypothetical protein